MENILLTAGIVLFSVAVIVIVGAAGLIGFTMFRIRRVASNTTVQTNDPLLADLNPNQPALVYFTAEWCGPCKLTQTPIIEKIRAEYTDLQILTVDLDDRPDDAKRWGVMSAPRTFVLSPDHQVHATNLDVADYGTLKTQIETAKGKT